jgi:hypothetical protein
MYLYEDLYNEIKKYTKFSQDKEGRSIFCKNNQKEKSEEKCLYLEGKESFTCNLFLQNNILFYRESGSSFEILRCAECLKYFKIEE